jgi:hypothetical protein
VSDPRMIECQKWAEKKAKQLAKTSKVELLEIRPKAGYRFLSGIRLPPGDKIVCPSPPWFYHYAVYCKNLVKDEIWPYGISMAKYKAKFEHHDANDFVLSPFPSADSKRKKQSHHPNVES